jgi:cytochrome P450
MTTLPPRPPGHFLTGNLSEFRRDMLAFYTRMAREYGDIVRVRLGPRSLFLVNHPDLIEDVLVRNNHHYRKHYELRMNRLLLGNGLLNSDGDFWLRQRRLVQPAFAQKRLTSVYAPVMVDYTERLLAEWQDGQIRDVHTDMSRLTLQIIAKTLFDADVHDDASDVGTALAAAQDSFTRRFQSLVQLPEWVPTPGNIRLWRAIRRLNAIVYRFIEQRRAAARTHEAGSGPTPSDSDGPHPSAAPRSSKTPHGRLHPTSEDLLSLLLQARDEDDGSRMTDRQLRDEAMTLFLAGHETTSLALSWTWYLLAQNPDVDAKLHAELRDVLGNRSPEVGDLPRLRYTDHVVREAMRVYPPAYAIGREAKIACDLGGYTVPRGQTVLMAQWVLHRDPRFWPEAEKFDPDRWDSDPLSRLPKYAYFPFGGGPRICIGNHFAMMEATLILATVARRFRMERADTAPVRPLPSLTLRPEGGIMMRLHARR